MAYYDDPLAILQPGYIPGAQSGVLGAINPATGLPWGTPAVPQMAQGGPQAAPQAAPAPPEDLSGDAHAGSIPAPSYPIGRGLSWLGNGIGSMFSGPAIPPRQFDGDAGQQPAAPAATPEAAPQPPPQAATEAPTGAIDAALAQARQDAGKAATGAPAAPAPDAMAEPQAAPKDGAFYATAAPPPPAFAPLVSAAAQKYGVPENVLTWVGAHESNWDPKAVGMQTSSGKAQGMFQFMPGTAKQYGIDPTDPAQSIDGAARYLKELADKNGGDWTKAVEQYGTFSTGMGSQRDAAAKAGFQTFLGQSGTTQTAQAPGQPGPTIMNAGEEGGPQQGRGLGQPAQDPTGLGDQSLQALMAAFKPSQSQQLAALASGLLSGPTFGAGLGKGLTALSATDTQARDFALKAAMARATMGYHQGQLGLGQQRANTGQQNADQHNLVPTVVQTPSGPQVIMVPKTNPGGSPAAPTVLPGQTAPMINAGAHQLQAETGALNASPGGAAAKTGEVQDEKAARTDITASVNSRAADEQTVADAQDLLKQADAHPELLGSTLKARAGQALTRMGVLGDPSDLDMLVKATTQERNNYLTRLTGGHVGGIRSNAEVTNLSKAMPDIATNPAAFKYVVSQLMATAQAGQAWREHVLAAQQANPGWNSTRELFGGQHYTEAKDAFAKDYWAAHPMPTYGNPTPAGTTGGKPSISSFWSK